MYCAKYLMLTTSYFTDNKKSIVMLPYLYLINNPIISKLLLIKENKHHAKDRS